jgi:hypothetical protein
MNRYLSIAAGLLAIIAVFLPFMRDPLLGSFSIWSAGTLAGTHADSIVLIFTGLVIAGIGFADRRWLNIVNILAFLFLMFKTLQNGVASSEAHMKPGIAVYLFLLAALLTLVGAIWGMVKKNKVAATPAV